MRASLFYFFREEGDLLVTLRPPPPPPPRKPAASDGAAPDTDTLLFLRSAANDFMSLFMSLFHRMCRMYERAKPGFYSNMSVMLIKVGQRRMSLRYI